MPAANGGCGNGIDNMTNTSAWATPPCISAFTPNQAACTMPTSCKSSIGMKNGQVKTKGFTTKHRHYHHHPAAAHRLPQFGTHDVGGRRHFLRQKQRHRHPRVGRKNEMAQTCRPRPPVNRKAACILKENHNENFPLGKTQNFIPIY